MNDADYILRQNRRYAQFHETRNLFFESLCAAEQHWFFVQGYDAYVNELYLPALSSLLNGIEATLRVMVHFLNNADRERPAGEELGEPSRYRVLSNAMIREAHRLELPVQYLAFNDEPDFFAKLASTQRNKTDVEIVRVRNNICHGNVSEYVNTDLGPRNSFFTPNCLRVVTDKVLAISADWCEALAKFKRQHGMMPYPAK